MHHLVVKQLLSCGELSPVHRPITTWPRILGHCAEEKKALSHFGNSTRDRVKEREEKIPSQSMPPRPRNNKVPIRHPWPLSPYEKMKWPLDKEARCP